MSMCVYVIKYITINYIYFTFNTMKKKIVYPYINSAPKKKNLYIS